jgi:hypothetical protein
MRWTKGQSGNPRGRPPAGRSLAELLRAAGDAPVSVGDPRSRQALLVDNLWAAALAGDLHAVRLLLEYVIGKPLPIAQDQAELDRFVKHYVTISPDDWPASPTSPTDDPDDPHDPEVCP